MSANQNFPLLQKKVAATGKLRKYTRKMLMAILKKRGAYPTCYVSRRTDYLIVGERPGIKLERAITLGVSSYLDRSLNQCWLNSSSTIKTEISKLRLLFLSLINTIVFLRMIIIYC